MGRSSGPRGGSASSVGVELAVGREPLASCFAEHPLSTAALATSPASTRRDHRRVTPSPPCRFLSLGRLRRSATGVHARLWTTTHPHCPELEAERLGHLRAQLVE